MAPGRRRGPAAPHYSAPEVLALLEREYGPISWRPRYDPITELVFTILSQHTSDTNALRALQNLRQAFPTWEALLEGEEERIARAIWTAGLARQKAPRLKAVLGTIKERRGHLDLSFLQDLPLEEAKAWLRSLPGVGPKTAAVVLCFSLGRPAFPVDTHVHRVARRLGLIGPRVSAEQAHDLLEKQVPPEKVYPLHIALITHGRRVCKAQRPLCSACVLREGCPSRQDVPSPPFLSRKRNVLQ